MAESTELLSTVLCTSNIVVHINSFNNVDLFSRGIYFLRLSICGEADNINRTVNSTEDKEAIPYQFKPSESTKIAPSECSGFTESTIRDHYFHTRAFAINYRDEVVQLDEIVQFQHTSDIGSCTGPTLLPDRKLVLKMELMFSKFSKDKEKETPPPAPTTNGVQKDRFECVSCALYRLNLWRDGSLHEYIPITFDASHFVRVDAMVHCALHNVTHRRIPPIQQQHVPPSSSTSSPATRRRASTALAPNTNMDASSRSNSSTDITIAPYTSPLTTLRRYMVSSLSPAPALLGDSTGAPPQPPWEEQPLPPASAMPDSQSIEHNSTPTLTPVAQPAHVFWSSYAQFCADGKSNNNGSVNSLVDYEIEQQDEEQKLQRRIIMYNFTVSPMMDSLEAHLEVRRWLQCLLNFPGQKMLGALCEPPGEELLPYLKRVLELLCIRRSSANGNWTPSTSSFYQNTREWCNSASIAKVDKQIPAAISTSHTNIQKDKSIVQTPPAKIGTLHTHTYPELESDDKAAESAESAIHFLARIGYTEWDRFVNLLPSIQEQLQDELRERWLTQLRVRWACHTFQHTTQLNWWIGNESQISVLDAGSFIEDLLRSPYALLEEEVDGEEVESYLRSRGKGMAATVQSSQQCIDLQLFPPDAQPPMCMLQRYSPITPPPEPEHPSEQRRSSANSSRSCSPQQTRKSVPERWVFAETDIIGPRIDVTRVEQSSDLGSFFQVESNGLCNGSKAGASLSGLSVPIPHVIVLQHGFQATHFDMRLLRNQLKVLFPNALLVNAESNGATPNASLREMGRNLASEVRRFVDHYIPDLLVKNRKGRLSFIGHSAGAVIIRAALTSHLMAPLLCRLHMFLSLCGPHLGSLYGDSAVVGAGMWAIKVWSKAAILDELMLTDAADPKDTFLFWLSQQPGLGLFRHVVLANAARDLYVPKHSARIQLTSAVARDASNSVGQGRLVADMASYLLAPIHPNRLCRMSLYTDAGSGSVDKALGRAAHVSVLDSPPLVSLILSALHDLLS